MADIAVIPSTITGGPERILRNYWKQQLLDILENELLATDLCDRQVIPPNAGTVIEFHRINSFPKQTTGVSQFLGYASFGDLKGRVFTVDSIVYALALLGNDMQLSEQSIMTAEPNPIPTLTERFLYNAKDTLDQYAINIMVCNLGNSNTLTPPSVDYNGSSVSTTVTWGDGSQTLTEATLDADNPSHRIAAESFNTSVTGLRSRNARSRMGSARSAFDCLIAPECAGDLRTDATFQDIALKGTNTGQDKFEKAMVGEVFGARINESTNVSVNFPGLVDTSDQIVRNPVVGDGYCGAIHHGKGIGVPRVNYIPPTQPDKNDPYGNVGIMTWKIYVANGGVLNPLAGDIIKVATTRAKSTADASNSEWE